MGGSKIKLERVVYFSVRFQTNRCHYLDVDYAGESLTIAFNSRYLMDSLNALAVKEVKLAFQDPLSPAQLTPTDDPDTLAVVMPMRA